MMYPKSLSARRSAVKKEKRGKTGETGERTCWLCGRNGCTDPLDKHHIFGGAFRQKSERYGLTVYLCHCRCHETGTEAAHRNTETMQALHAYGQRKAMEEQGWEVPDFICEFGRNYI